MMMSNRKRKDKNKKIGCVKCRVQRKEKKNQYVKFIASRMGSLLSILLNKR